MLPELVEVLSAFVLDPAARKMHKQITIPVAHVISAFHVRVELALWVDTDVLAYERVLEHQMFECVLLRTWMLLAHQHGVIHHHFQYKSRECGAAEESAASIDALVILGDQDIDILDAEFGRGRDVGGADIYHAAEDGSVAHQPLLDSFGRNDVVDQIDVGCHDNNVGIDEPDPLGGRLKEEGFGDGRNLGPSLYEPTGQ